jgi:hypothetical protein
MILKGLIQIHQMLYSVCSIVTDKLVIGTKTEGGETKNSRKEKKKNLLAQSQLILKQIN